MGLLGSLRQRAAESAKSQVKRVIRKVAATANIPMNESREDRDRAEIEAAKAQGAPSFSQEGAAGWRAGRDGLSKLGVEGLGMVQARWTDSELSASSQVAAWAKALDGAGGIEQLRWTKAGEVLLSGWQTRGEEVAQAWTRTFDSLVAAWDKAGADHSARVHTEGWRQAAADFDRAWQKEWESLQGELQGAAARMKATVADARGTLGGGLPTASIEAWQKAGDYLESTILRAEAELWGVWGTNGASIRAVSREVTEGRGAAEQRYPDVFTHCEADFALGFKHTLSDFETSWKNALELIRAAS